jgi:hypothetical protein
MTMIREREEKRLGRPLKPPTPGKRVSLGLKVTAEVKQKIDEEARKTGRTQSQQAELLLERAFTEDAGFGGSEVRRLAIFMASAFAIAGQRSAAGKADWMDDPIAYSAGAAGVLDALLTGFPSGEDKALALEGLASRLLSRIAQEKEKNK